MKLKIGGIYKVDMSRLYNGYGPIEMYISTQRVLFYDKFEVFVDVLHPSESEWNMTKMEKKHLYFGRSSMKHYDEFAVEIGFQEFTSTLEEYYRTDLLLRISRIRDISWSDNLFDNFEQLRIFINQSQTQSWKDQRIDCGQVFLIAHGKQGGGRAPILVESENGKYFTACEILWKAGQVQRNCFAANSPGVGIFRSGMKSGIPVFYIGDYLDRAKFLEDFEEIGIDTNR